MSNIKKSQLYLILILTFLITIASATALIEKQWTVMKSGNPYLLTAESEDEMALYQLVFFSAEAQNATSIKIYSEPGSQANIYQKIIIEKTNMNQDLLSPGSIKLKVKNEWIEQNVPNTSSVKLAGEDGKVLSGNNIVFTRKGDVYSYYTGSIPMSTFYIATTAPKTATPAATTEAAETSQEDNTTEAPVSETAEESASQEKYQETGQDQQVQEQPSCEDNLKNQDESGIDCGGSCGRCDDSEACQSNDDCQSMYCHQSTCRTPSCSDGIKNQQESDVDCGGSCQKCEISFQCSLNDDCSTGLCEEGACAEEKVKTALLGSFSFKDSFNKINSKVTLSESAKNNFKYATLGVLGLVVLVLLVLFLKKKLSVKKEPSVQDLMKLYDEIKRI